MSYLLILWTGSRPFELPELPVAVPLDESLCRTLRRRRITILLPGFGRESIS